MREVLKDVFLLKIILADKNTVVSQAKENLSHEGEEKTKPDTSTRLTFLWKVFLAMKCV